MRTPTPSGVPHLPRGRNPFAPPLDGHPTSERPREPLHSGRHGQADPFPRRRVYGVRPTLVASTARVAAPGLSDPKRRAKGDFHCPSHAAAALCKYRQRFRPATAFG